ncbi:kinase-like domain-containing protein, partial [Boletus edulis BED1]
QILRRELGLLRRLEHSNIVPLLGVSHNFGPILAAVLPWMANGTLHSFLKNKGRTLSIDERLKLVHGIGSGLEYLHSLSVFHGDLHSGNVLIDEEQNPRISDFGLACTIGKLQPGLSYLQRLSSTSNVGAVRWAAPERLWLQTPPLRGHIFTWVYYVRAKTDFLQQVLSGDIPWKDKTTYQVVALKLHAHQPPSRPIHTAVEDEHWTLMVRCWSYPQRRPSAREVVVVIQTFSSSGERGCISHAEQPKCIAFFFFWEAKYKL